jgi:hypothetical protein
MPSKQTRPKKEPPKNLNYVNMKLSQFTLLICLLPAIAGAQNQIDSASQTVIAEPVQTPVATSVKNIRADAAHDIRLGDVIEVSVQHLNLLVRQHSNDTARIQLFLNNVPMSSIKAFQADTVAGKLVFKITRGNGSNPWNVFYQSPFHPILLAESISIGYPSSGAIATQVDSKSDIRIILIRSSYLVLALFLMALLIVLWLFGVKRGMLKDESVLPDIQQRPYSLGRTQLAFWSVIVALSYIFIALVTGELAPLSTSTLVLLGVSGVTTAAATLIDNNDKLNNKNRHQNGEKSAGLLTDLLSDNNGISIHRFQMLVFNIILGVFFIKQVVTQLSMPDFDNNMLLLLGISNGTYAGIKMFENNNTTPPAVPPSTPVNNPS